MDVLAVKRLVEAGVLADVPACRAELAAITSVRALLAARELRVTQRLDELCADTEGEVAEHTKGTASKASKVLRRKKTCDDVPQLGAALGEGETTEAHVDAVARALADLSAEDQARLADCGDEIRAKAGVLGEVAFREWLAGLVRRVRSDDGLRRLERQKAAARATTWTDAEGMFHLHAKWDPETGIGLNGRLRNTIEAMFHAGVPEGAPLDPLERQQWLAALALAALIRGDVSCACCDVVFEHCEIHHVVWFDNGGATDITDLLPLCRRHHHLAHEGGWKLALLADRTLRVTLPNGDTRVHSPPLAHAA